MVFDWSLTDSKSPQIPTIPLGILANHNNSVVWMVSTRPPISNSSWALTKPLDIFPSAPITMDITAISSTIAFLVLWQGLSSFLATSKSIILLLFYLLRVFHISWWFFTGVWVTASLLDTVFLKAPHRVIKGLKSYLFVLVYFRFINMLSCLCCRLLLNRRSKSS